jgi:uncharacterized coiled-coil DUF342 family protein
MNDICKKLRKELLDIAQPYLDQIQELETRSENKESLVSSLSREVEDKERQAEDLESEAGESLGRGEDPRPLLSRVATLKTELEDLKKALAAAGQPSKAEQDRIQELKQEMSRAIHKKVEQTKTFQDQSQLMLDSMRQAVKAKDEWTAGLEAFCAEIGADARKHWLLDLSENSEGYRLGRKIGAYTQRYAQVFSK